MLFKRYSDVSFLLRSIQIHEFDNFLKVMFEESQNDTIWEVWLRSQTERSFADFKQEVINRSRSKEEIEIEAYEGMDKALGLLDRIGGDVLGG